MNKKEQTTNTYNVSALALAKKFDELGVRASDIEETFALIDKKDAHVLEIGCGNGRDAEEITKHTNTYLGIDISEKLIELTQQKVPHAHFHIADIETCSMKHADAYGETTKEDEFGTRTYYLYAKKRYRRHSGRFPHP